MPKVEASALIRRAAEDESFRMELLRELMAEKGVIIIMIPPLPRAIRPPKPKPPKPPKKKPRGGNP